MKIAALIMFKNEQFNLPNCLRSISGVVDVVLGYDDFSSDDSALIFKSFGGILVGQNLGLRHVNGEEKEIRSVLFDAARKLDVTHYLCIDADEFFSDFLRNNFRQYCEKLTPGQKLFISWVNLANSGDSYYPEGNPFQPTLKDFVVMDNPDLSYSKGSWSMHFDRTPSSVNASDPAVIPSNKGAVMHAQHLDPELYELKQAKYKCLELTKTPGSAFQINDNTRFTLTRIDSFQGLPDQFRFDDFEQVTNDLAIKETLSEIESLFVQFGVLYFERLEIWHVHSLREYFIQGTSRPPKNFFFSKFMRKVKLKCLSVFRNKRIMK